MAYGIVNWFLAAALGQGAAGDSALKAIPADAEIVVHVRSLSGVRDDTLAMLKAMSPTLADQVAPMIEQSINPQIQRYGAKVTDADFFISIKFPGQAGAGQPQMVVVFAGDYDETLAAFSGGKPPQTKKLEGGVESFNGVMGETMYSARRDGATILGPEEEPVRAAAASTTKGIDTRLTQEIRSALFGGDIGVYVDAAKLQDRFANEIDGARDQIMALMDQAGEQMAAGQAEQAKQVYTALFDAIKQADSLALNVDLDKAAFDLSGLLTVKAGSPAAAMLKSAKTSAAETLEKLPAGGLAYVYAGVDPEMTGGLMRWNLSNLLGPGADALGDSNAMVEALKAAGRMESFGMMSFENGIKMTNLATAAHPDKLAASMNGWTEIARKSPSIKEVAVETNVASHRGFELSRATMSFDLEKLVGGQAAANPAALGVVKSMLGDGTQTTFYGSDGNRFVSIATRTLDEAKSQIDALLDGSNTVGQSAGFRAARERLPRETTGMMLFSAQGIVRIMAQTLGTVMGGQPMALPADMSKEPAFLGGSLAMTPAGYQFDFVIPSAVGPVLEKGLMPLFLELQGKINQ